MNQDKVAGMWTRFLTYIKLLGVEYMELNLRDPCTTSLRSSG
jgi:hypothetical protein